MEKGKRILALIGIILLVALYAVTIIAAIFDNTNTMRYLSASLMATVVVPVFIWVYQLIYRLVRNRKKDRQDEEE